MSWIRLVCVCLAVLLWQASFAADDGRSSGTLLAAQGKAGQAKARKKPAAEKPSRSTAVLDVNRLSLEFKALRTLRYFEATPAQLSEIARMAKDTASKSEKREAAKASNAYIETLTELNNALAANDEQKIETLREKLDGLEESDPPILDDEIEITDAAEIEAARLLNMMSAQQLVGLAVNLEENLSDPVQLIVDGLEEGRQQKGEDWEAARDELAERIAWIVCGLNGEKELKLEEQVSTLLDRKHAQEGTPSDLQSEIRKLVGSPGPVVLLKNVLEHELAELLSNPRLEEAATSCLHGPPAPAVAAEEPSRPAVKKQKKAPGEKSAAPKSGRAGKAAELDEFLKSPENFSGQELTFENVTITGTAPARQESMSWLEVKSASGQIVHAAMRGQKITFVVAKADVPEALNHMAPGMTFSATIVCRIRGGAQGAHWFARVQHLEVQGPK